MNIRGEVRESVSLDEDDLSDVEDEVFIRDSKNGYKFEDVSVKKPLMAPRRKIRTTDKGSRMINKPPCRAMCRLCCYAFVGLSVLIGLLVLVVVLVSLFPLPLDKFKEWIVTKPNEKEATRKIIPCNNLEVTDVWTATFPKLISESSVQVLDVNQDGIDDVIFGFGTGVDNYIPTELFCKIFLELNKECLGGVIALNGSNGHIFWRTLLSNSVFSLICTTDVNGDNLPDCLVTGKGGIFTVINPKDGSLIWKFADTPQDTYTVIDVYWANFIPDQDNDTVPDIIASHSVQQYNNDSRPGYLLVVSGKTGAEIVKVATPNNVETYYIPQLLPHDHGNYSVIFGTGSPVIPGNLSVISLKDLLAGNMMATTIYEDYYKGVLTSSILVDITNDGQLDIITAMFNTTVVAIDGNTFKQIWKYDIPNSETLSPPTPGYFNSDNVTDFLVKYQTGLDFPEYYYSQTIILDGKTGNPIYDKPIIDSVGTQMGGLTLGFEEYGFDTFLYWTADCRNFERNQSRFDFPLGTTVKTQSRVDLCKIRFNSSMVAKLYALNQFEQPPGIEVYNSENRVPLEFNYTKTPLQEVELFLKQNPDVNFNTNPQPSRSYPLNYASIDYDQNQPPFREVKYEGGSSFRHKDNGKGLIRDFAREDVKRRKNSQLAQPKYTNDYEQPSVPWQQQIAAYPNEDIDADYPVDEQEAASLYRQNKLFRSANSNNRDPRSKSESTIPDEETTQTTTESKRSKKKNLSDRPYGPYDYRNVRKARTRLLHDLNNVPSDILRDTYFKNREGQLKRSRFEQRDLKSHRERIFENEEIHKVIEQEKKMSYNNSESLWDVESEKELQERGNGYWRGKRELVQTVIGIPRFTSVGAFASSLHQQKNSIDLILITYWLPPKTGPELLLRDYVCVKHKFDKNIDLKAPMSEETKLTLEERFMRECLQERGINTFPKVYNALNVTKEQWDRFPYYDNIVKLSLGQLTVYRLQLQCTCCKLKKDETCAKLSSIEDQRWGSYMGKLGDGIFNKNA